MRLISAQVQNYRSVVDSTRFAVEQDKTILVGVNEAGKTALLRALQHVNPPSGVYPSADLVQFDYREDCPRPLLNGSGTSEPDAATMKVVEATFALEDDDLEVLPREQVVAASVSITVRCYMDNSRTYSLAGLTSLPTFGNLKSDVRKLIDSHSPIGRSRKAMEVLQQTLEWDWDEPVGAEVARKFRECLEHVRPFVEGTYHETRWKSLMEAATIDARRQDAMEALKKRLPLTVYYSRYFTLRPRINLEALAERQERENLEANDFGNLCLLKLLGFTARELSEMAKNPPVKPWWYALSARAQQSHEIAVKRHHRSLDLRLRRLEAASRKLTEDIRRVWGEDTMTLRLVADGQYLTVMVEDDVGMSVELDQRSEGFRWLVSFFVVFRAQAQDELKDAVLLLDEPGLSLHALKQQEFRKTVSLLGQNNQIIYTTHSPFMVGSDELDLVRIVEMIDRHVGTKVHTSLQVDDPRSIFPLQAALGYDLAQSMLSQKRNLVVEGVTDMFYLNAVNEVAQAENGPIFEGNPAIVPAGTASKIAYFCTIYTTQNLSVAALLDSDKAGDQAATQDALKVLLGGKAILRTGDFINPAPKGAEIEDLFRHTLTAVAKNLGWDSEATITAQPFRPIMDILDKEHGRNGKKVSKWQLSKAFAQWLHDNGYSALSEDERAAWKQLTQAVNKAL